MSCDLSGRRRLGLMMLLECKEPNEKVFLDNSIFIHTFKKVFSEAVCAFFPHGYATIHVKLPPINKKGAIRFPKHRDAFIGYEVEVRFV